MSEDNEDDIFAVTAAGPDFDIDQTDDNGVIVTADNEQLLHQQTSIFSFWRKGTRFQTLMLVAMQWTSS